MASKKGKVEVRTLLNSTVECIWEFKGRDPSQLTLAKRERVVLLRVDAKLPGWGWARRADGTEGWLPLNYIRVPKRKDEATQQAQEEQAKEAQQEEDVGANSNQNDAVDPNDYSWAFCDNSAEVEEAIAALSSAQKRTLDLLRWVDARIPNCYVRGFSSSSWSDGHALLELINSLRPGTFDLPAQFSFEHSENVALALDTARRELHVTSAVEMADFSVESCDPYAIERCIEDFREYQERLLDEAHERERRLRLVDKQLPKPAVDTVFCNVLDASGNYRASIERFGAVTDCYGQSMGFIDMEQMSASTPAKQALGYVLSNQVYDASSETQVGEIDRGTGCIRDELGTTLLQLQSSGEARDALSTYLGRFEGAGFAEIDVVALFVLFISPEFLQANEAEPEKKIMSVPQDSWCNVFGKTRFRAWFTEQGLVHDCYGALLGFLDVARRRLMNKQQQLAAYVLGDQVYDATDQQIGEIDRGLGTIKAEHGSTVLALAATGHCKGATEVRLGEFRGFSYRELDFVALYVLVLDTDFCNEASE